MFLKPLTMLRPPVSNAVRIAAGLPARVLVGAGLGGSERVRQCHNEILLRGEQLGREVEAVGGERRDVG
jgi:hypothetical protein